MVVIDMQVHVWRPLRPGEQWDPVWPPHREPFLVEDLLAAMDETGVDRAVLVTPASVGFNDGYLLEAAGRWPQRFAVMGRIDPTASGAPERLATWLDQPGMVALRFGIPVEPWITWLRDGALDWCWPEAERLGIPTSVYAPGSTNCLGPIAARHPDLTLIVDHLALPLRTGPAAFSELGEVLDLARYPNVFVKVSALPLYSSEPFPFRDLHPHIRRVYDAFGPQRMMWGSDLSRMRCTYREALGLFAEGCDFLSADDRSWILGRTAARVLGWRGGTG